MKNIAVPEWVESRFPLYAAENIHSLYSTSSVPMRDIEEESPALIAIASGEGQLQAEGQSFEIKAGSLILLPAKKRASLSASRNQPLHAYKLAFGIREQARGEFTSAMSRRSELASNAAIEFLPYEPAILAQVEELFKHRSPENEIRHVQNQIVFHQILLQLLERRESRNATGEQPSIERSISYMENCFYEKITREQLAEMAGVSASHYSILLKQLTGFSPSEYLSRLRVHRAKELLLNGSNTLREIAQKVGYKDEFYLSRRFKQQTGEPPSGYNSGSSRRVAVLLAPYASHLMLLGVEPAVFVSDSNEYVTAEGVRPPEEMKIVSADSAAEQIRAALLESGIELIIAAGEHMREFGLSSENLRAVAPVLEISWMELGWQDHLRLIAGYVQRSEQAERWLAEFEEEERKARTIIQRSEVAREVVTILVIKPEQLLVYGARNVGYVMYRSLGLQPPARMKEEIEKHGDRCHSLVIELSQLEEYAGDRILVIIFPDVKGSTAHSEAVFESSHWQELTAVKRNQVHLLELDDWIPYNPVSIRLQLQRAVDLFASHQ